MGMNFIRSKTALIGLLALSIPLLNAQDVDDHVHLIKNPDGSFTKFIKDLNNTSLLKQIYEEKQNGEKIILTTTTYLRDKNGKFRSGIIEDHKRRKLYKLRYGYEPRTGRLIAENMYDARHVHKNDPLKPNKETPIRALRYTYNQEKTAKELKRWLKENKFEKGTFPNFDPFAPKEIKPNAPK